MREQRKKSKMSEKILLHACCAVCAGYPLQLLSSLDYTPVVYFYNPNIHPKKEYDRRLKELISYCWKKNYELIIEEDDTKVWFDYVKGLENEPERGKRCLKCFELRLNKTAQKAIQLEINKFSTTLMISPHKVRKDIVEVGQNIAKKYDLEFVDTDFRKQNGFLKTMAIAKEENFYRQKYCGCVYAFNQQNSESDKEKIIL